MSNWARGRVALVFPWVCGLAHGGDAGTLQGALESTKPLIELRLRMENVDQEGLPRDARAITLRARLGFETGKFLNTSLMIEADGIVPIRNDYRPDPTIASMTSYPVVADAKTYEINRLQLTNTSLPGTTITLGRQRILLDDQRFIGNSGWRQNEQTFDALRFVNKSIANLTIDASWLNQVNRVNGPDSPQGRYEGDSFLFNAGYQTGVGRISAYGYLLGFDNLAGVPAAVRDSSSTYGLRFAGEKLVGKIRLAYLACYARQTDHERNPLDFDVAYEAAELTGTFEQYSLGAGTEILAGNGVKGFTTPLASLHKFQGWADKFTVTPPHGLEDRSVNAGATYKALGKLDSLSFVVSYHDFQAEHIAADYGHEWDASVAARIKHVNLLLKYADYRQGELASARTTEKLWAQLEYLW
jgi:hypothetical protein